MSDYEDPSRRPTSPVQQSWATRAAQRRTRSSSPLSSISPVTIGLMAVLLVLVVAGGWLLFGQGSGSSTARVTRPTLPVITPGATALPPVPVVRTATVVGLGSAPGRLHETPSYNTPTLTVVLKEGDKVTLLDRQQRDDAGNQWQLVASGDYVGWIPVTNLDTTR